MYNFILSLYSKHNGMTATKIEPKYTTVDFITNRTLIVTVTYFKLHRSLMPTVSTWKVFRYGKYSIKEKDNEF